MKLAIILIACLIARHHRRRYLRASARLATTLTTADCHKQHRWQRDQTASRMRVLRMGVRAASAMVVQAEARVGGRCVVDATWN